MVRRPKKKVKKTARKKPASKKRVTRKAPAKKRVSKKTPSKKRSVKKTARISESPLSNQESQWKVYKNLQQRIDKAWEQLQKDVNSNAPEHITLRNKNHLLLLLGECNYMARECVRSNPKEYKPNQSGSTLEQK